MFTNCPFHLVLSLLVTGAIALGTDKLVIFESNDPDEGKILLIARPHDKCQVTKNPEVIDHVTKKMADLIYKPKSKHDLFEILEKCGFDLKQLYKKYVTDERSQVHTRNVIYPGTLWCGEGTNAENDDQLGTAEETDKCCRTHDKCGDIILAGETGHNLTNDSPYTYLSCECDDAFMECLYKADNVVANEVGGIYFNGLKRKCYEYDYPMVCKDGPDVADCTEYGRDTTQPKTYIWRSAHKYERFSFGGIFF